MSIRDLTIAGFGAVALVAVFLYLAGRTHRLGLASLGEVTDALRSSTLCRIALVLGWGWVGWHLLAR